MPPRPRTPRPRVSPSRRPRVAGLAPAAPRPDGPTRPSAFTDEPLSDPAAVTTARPAPDAGPSGAAPSETPAAEPESAEPESAEPVLAELSRRRPRPRPAARETGGDSVAEPAVPSRSGNGLGGALRGRAVALLAAALVVLSGAAVFFGVQDTRLRGTPAALNTALVDVGVTAEAAGQLSDAIETIYSFDFARLDENENAAREVITPAFAEEFGRLFGEVRARAPQQQAVVSATVTLSAVKELSGDRAVLVAFIDQQATRAAPDAESQQLAAAGRLTVTGERVDGRWKIAAVTPL